MFLSASAVTVRGREEREKEQKETRQPLSVLGFRDDKGAPRNSSLIGTKRKYGQNGNGDENTADLSFVQFGLQSPDEIRAHGVVNVTNHRLYEKHRPAKNGLFDLRMGPPNRDFTCETCNNEHKECPGHFGYIELAVPCYNPLFMTIVSKVLNCVCINCSSLLVAKTDAFLRKIRSIRLGRARLKYIFESLKKKPIRTCGVCQAESRPTIVLPGEEEKVIKEGMGKKMRFFLPDDAKANGSRSVWSNGLGGAAGEGAEARKPAFIVQAQPSVSHRHAEKDPDALVTEKGCLAIQPKIVQEGPKLLAVWPDLPKLYRFLVTGENEEIDKEEQEDEDDDEEKKDEGEEADEAPPPPRKKAKKKTDKERDEEEAQEKGVEKVDEHGEKIAYTKTGKRKVKKASEATQADVAALMRRSPYTMQDSAKPGARDTFGAGRAYDVLKCLSDEDAWLLGFDPEHSHPAWLISTVLPVMPPCCRPPITLPHAKKSLIQDHLTIKLLDIVKKNNTLHKQLHFNNKDWHDQYGFLLQWHVATYIDNTDKSRPTAKLDSGRPMGCIIERWKGKRGRIRGNLMGKRVDFTSRSVITPDANLKVDELGVPYLVCKTLTFPEKVTPLNIVSLQESVARGPDDLLGAKYIIDDKGRHYDLRYKRDISLQIGWTVERTLRKGDTVVFNRQPSLHKMSMMGFRVVPLKFATFRLNLAVTQAFNADFDGDEMNLHAIQSYAAVAEVQQLMAVHTQVLTPQRNAPIMGLTQDSLTSTRIFTQRDTFLTKSDMMQLMLTLIESGALVTEQQKRLPIPAIVHSPCGPLWTGKQVISMLLPSDLQLDTNSKFAEKDKDADVERHNRVYDPKDTHVRIVDGELLTGTLDKKTVGSIQGSLVHIINNDYGGQRTLDLLNALMFVLHEWMTHRGFSVGLADMTPSPKVREGVQKVIADTRVQVSVLAEKMKRGELDTVRGQSQQEAFEVAVNNELNKTRDRCGHIAAASFPNTNALKLMVTAGSKGNETNIAQMAGAVGQQNLAGKRIPMQFQSNTRAFPHCVAGDLNDIEGRGFVRHSYFDGLSPIEFFSHAIGGREGVTDTAVKTSETGYLQRRLVKAMEDLHVAYDKTVRDSTNAIVQFSYGEDDRDGVGVESQRIELLGMNDYQLLTTFFIGQEEKENNGKGKKNAPSVAALSNVFRQADGADLQALATRFATEGKEEEERETVSLDEQEQELIWDELDRMCRLRDALREYIFRGRSDEHYWPLPCNVRRTIGRAQSRFKQKKNESCNALSVKQVLEALQRFQERIWQNGDPLVALNNAVAEERQIDTTFLFLVQVLSMLSPRRAMFEWRLSCEAFEWVLETLVDAFQRAAVNPGEAVGALAGQSIGEPATQMTLNTFHSAGISSRNVTLGLPRLEELMKATRQMKTPSMTMYLTSSERRRDPIEEADRARLLANRMQFTRVRDLVRGVPEVFCDPLPGTTVARDREFVEQWYATEPPPTEPLSDWVIRLVLNREALAEREYSVTQVAMCLRQSFTSAEQRYLYVVSSDDNDYRDGDGGIILLRLFQSVLDKHVDVSVPSRESMADPTVLDNCTPQQWAERTYSAFAQHVAQFALKLYVGGIENVTKVSARQVTTVVYDRHTGKARDDHKEWVLDTDGTNMLGVMPLAGVDGRRVLSNNPVEVASVLGVEVARQVLLNEMRSVLSFYGLYVNYRHLSLLCDFMTHFGSVRAISRHTLNKRRTGPLMRCTFEEPVDTLCEAAIYSELDRLDSVSQCVMFGKPMPYGTGIVSLVTDQLAMKMHRPPKQKMNLAYLQQTVIANPFDDRKDEDEEDEDGEKKEDVQKTTGGRKIALNVFDPFAVSEDTANVSAKVLGQKRSIDGETRPRIVSYNPFAAEQPMLCDLVVERQVSLAPSFAAKEEAEKAEAAAAAAAASIYVPSSPRRLSKPSIGPITEFASSVATDSANERICMDAQTYYIPSTPVRYNE